MKQKINDFLRRLSRGPLGPVMCFLWDVLVFLEIQVFKLYFLLKGVPRPTKAQQDLVRENVTFVYKSFQRQRLAKRLYRNIQAYYPGVRVIIADDSSQPLQLEGPGLRIVQLPFNVGLSAGLNRALALVETPFVVRMDDDELLSGRSDFHHHLQFLLDHPEVDLVGILHMDFPWKKGWKQKQTAHYMSFTMSGAPKALKIPHGTRIGENRAVTGKTPNIFIVRTGAYREIGYDDHIRIMDHQDFFFRAAGNLVAVLDWGSFIFHDHCPFNRAYQVYRSDYMGDRRYIAMKMAACFHRISMAPTAQEQQNENN